MNKSINIGRFSQWVMALTACGVLCNCEEKKDSLAKRTGSKLGEAMTDFASGVGGGVDKQMLVEVELSDALKEKGFSSTVSKSLGLVGSGKGITVYVLSKNAFAGTFIAKVLNDSNLEVGRAVVEVEFTADDAHYVSFIFDEEVDMQLARRFTIDLREEKDPTEAKEEAAESAPSPE